MRTLALCELDPTRTKVRPLYESRAGVLGRGGGRDQADHRPPARIGVVSSGVGWCGLLLGLR
ncbi:hypothetical protein QFZ76_000809 [Streptomyces sp. V4I2]|nr:hypothetical protein [Streptomyces sp. V4I2]